MGACGSVKNPPALTYIGIGSNNPSRVYLALELFADSGSAGVIFKGPQDYGGMQSEEFLAINPKGKVPALIMDEAIAARTGVRVLYEAQVILDYLVDRFGWAAKVDAGSPELRAKVRLLIQAHDLYLASPNSTQPGHFANQACLYKPGIPLQYRATIYREFAKQLRHISELMFGIGDGSDYLVGGRLTLADIVIFCSYTFFKASSKLSLPGKLDAALAYNADPRWERWVSFLRKNHPGPIDKVGDNIVQFVAGAFGESSPVIKAEIESVEGQRQDWGL